jgi:hypothetical protein
MHIMLINMRNFVFAIKTSNKRQTLAGQYNENMQFMELSAYIAKERGVNMLMYNVPLRPSIKNPYPETPYRHFVEQMRETAGKYSPDVCFADYENIIPVSDWGQFYATSQPDFSHFMGAGHKILAGAVYEDMQKCGFFSVKRR